IYHYSVRFFFDHCVKGLCDGRRNVQIDIAFNRQDIRAVLTQRRRGWRSGVSHSILHRDCIALWAYRCVKILGVLAESRIVADFAWPLETACPRAVESTNKKTIHEAFSEHRIETAP